MFINLSNHPSSKWSTEQKEAANKWGKVVDFPFPNVLASASSNEVQELAVSLGKEVLNKFGKCIVLVQGEMTLTMKLVEFFKAYGCSCVAACSDRSVSEIVQEDGSTKKISLFKFIQFREY